MFLPLLVALALASLALGLRTASSAPAVSSAPRPLASAKVVPAAPVSAVTAPAASSAKPASTAPETAPPKAQVKARPAPAEKGADKDDKDAEKPSKPPPRPPGTPASRVTVGVYLHHIPELDLKTNTYIADFYLWFLWTGDVNPVNTFEFINVISPGDVSKVPAYTDDSGGSAPEELPDGRKYQVLHVQGRFLHPFPVDKFPFDEQDILIEIEDSKHTTAELVYEADVKGSGIHPSVRLTGYNIASSSVSTREAQFTTAFGDPRAATTKEIYSHFEFGMHVTRPVKGLFVKSIVPIILVVLITFGAFFCHPADIDARFCLTVTALIAAVALQYTSSSELPPTGYLVRLDKIYVLSYGLIMLATMCCVFSNRLAARNEATALRIDKISLGVLGVAFSVGVVLICLIG